MNIGEKVQAGKTCWKASLSLLHLSIKNLHPAAGERAGRRLFR